METSLTQRQRNAESREKLKRLFSTNPEVRAEAIEILKDCWDYDSPSFRIEELASFSSDNCMVMAARRDGQKELINWLLKL